MSRGRSRRRSPVLTETPAVGSAFCPAQAKDDTYAKALCVWLNSSLGLIGFYGNRTLKVLAYPRFSMEDMRILPVPGLADQHASTLAAVFDARADAEMQPFKAMNDCEVRAALDQAVAETVGSDIGFTAHDIDLVRQSVPRRPPSAAPGPSDLTIPPANPSHASEQRGGVVTRAVRARRTRPGSLSRELRHSMGPGVARTRRSPRPSQPQNAQPIRRSRGSGLLRRLSDRPSRSRHSHPKRSDQPRRAHRRRAGRQDQPRRAR